MDKGLSVPPTDAADVLGAPTSPPPAVGSRESPCKPPPPHRACEQRRPPGTQPAPGHTPSAMPEPCPAPGPVKRSGLKIPTSHRTEPRLWPQGGGGRKSGTAPRLCTGITSLLVRVCVCLWVSNIPLTGVSSSASCCGGLSREAPGVPTNQACRWSQPGTHAGPSEDQTPGCGGRW